MAKVTAKDFARLKRAEYESGESGGTESGVHVLGAVAGRIQAAKRRTNPTHHASSSSWRSKNPQTALLKQVKGVGTLIAMTYMLTLLKIRIALRKKSRRVGLLWGLTAATGRNSGVERAAVAYQQRGRPLILRILSCRGAVLGRLGL